MVQRLLRWRRHAKPGADARRRQLAQYNTRDARDLFSHLLRRARKGEEIVIAHAGMPVAKLVPYEGDEPRRPGLVRTTVVLKDVLVLDPARSRGPSATPTRSSRAAST